MKSEKDRDVALVLRFEWRGGGTVGAVPTARGLQCQGGPNSLQRRPLLVQRLWALNPAEKEGALENYSLQEEACDF